MERQVMNDAGPVLVSEHAIERAGRKLLLVDDVAMNRDVLGAFLRAAGYVVIATDGGRQAIRLASEHLFDLILMDVRMPDTDGLEATRHIRALPAPYGSVPVLALTSYGYTEQVAQCRLAGMNGHVSKPVDDRTLVAAVDDLIAGPVSTVTPLRSEAVCTEESPLRLDRSLLARALALLPSAEIIPNLQSLRIRLEQMVRLLDQGADPSMLADAAHVLGSASGLFGFVALSAAARSFERAATASAPNPAAVAEQLRTETCAALAALDELLRESWSAVVPAADRGADGVIVVENDPLIRGIIRGVLRDTRQQVFLAGDGIEAVMLARQFTPTLVLLDVAMPRLNGLLACEAIRALPGCADVPIIMLTGYADSGIQDAAARLGATGFLTKPFEPAALLDRLAVHIEVPAWASRTNIAGVPARAVPQETLPSGDDSLRGGWIRPDAGQWDAPHSPMKGPRHGLDEVYLYAGVPPDLVQKWFGYAPVSASTVALNASATGLGAITAPLMLCRGAGNTARLAESGDADDEPDRLDLAAD